jgi:hypothetical protein
VRVTFFFNPKFGTSSLQLEDERWGVTIILRSDGFASYSICRAIPDVMLGVSAVQDAMLGVGVVSLLSVFSLIGWSLYENWIIYY